MSVVQVKKRGMYLPHRTVIHGDEGRPFGKRLDYPQHLNDPNNWEISKKIYL